MQVVLVDLMMLMMLLMMIYCAYLHYFDLLPLLLLLAYDYQQQLMDVVPCCLLYHVDVVVVVP